MRRLIIIICLLTVGIAYADKISSPPPLPDEPLDEQNYLYEIYSNIHNLEITTTNPNSNRTGKTGDMLMYHTSATQYIAVNVGSKGWRGLELGNLP